MGDLNLDRLKKDKKENKLLTDIEDTFGLDCLIKTATRVTVSSSTLLDVIMTNKPDMFSTSGVLPIGISDHSLIYGFLKEEVKYYPNKVIFARSLRKLDSTKFSGDLKESKWLLEDTTLSAETQYTHWEDTLVNVMNKHIPLKKMRVRKRDVPYITAEWKEAIRKKRKYAKQFAKLKNGENHELMKFWRNRATKLRRQSIKAYWKSVSDDLKNNPKGFYSTFKPFISTNYTNNSKLDIAINDGGTIINDEKQVANILVKYFSTMADNIGDQKSLAMKESDWEQHRCVTDIRQMWNSSLCFSFKLLTELEVLSCLKNLNPNKACGYDQIPTRIFKLFAEELAPSLTTIYNLAIKEKNWPKQWKRGEWIPAFKKDDPLERTNYRPITLLIVADKVFEKLMCTQLTSFFEKCLDTFISAYRKRYSCETTTLRLVEDWREALDNGNSAGIISTDMSKAFDSMHSPLLLAKLKAYGLSDDALSLLRSYFTSRENRVRLGSTSSDWYPYCRGCPQGSALGPLLWNVYQNDLFYTKIESQLSTYADDHQLYSIKHSLSEAVSHVNVDASVISNWYKENLLKGNPKKYQAMVISKEEHDGYELKIDSHVIEQSSNLELLGITIDNRLSFSEQVSVMCRKVGKKIGVLMRLRNLIPVSAKLHIYKTVILPHLKYCSLVWHFCKATDVRKIERVNERGLRAVFCDWKLPYDVLLDKAEMSSLYNQRLQDIAIFMFKVKNKLLPENINSLFETNTSSYSLRNADFRQSQFHSTRFGRHSIKHFGPKLWSKLSLAERSITTIENFKKLIRKKDLIQLIDKNCNGQCYLCCN